MADIGATLREARIRAKIDINEVETRTKIRAKYLRAMENEEWDLLPGDVYVRSFLRTYGDFLGLDSRQLIDDFKRRYERPSDNEVRPITPRSRDRDRRSHGPRLPPWAVVGAVLVAVVVALYFVGRKPTSSTPSTPTAATKAGTRRGHRTQRGATSPGVAAAKAKPGHPRPRTVKLQLVPTAEVWVCVVDGSGKPLLEGDLHPGETIPTETSSKMLLTLGNASVTMRVNGRTVSVPPSSTAIGYRLTPTGQSTLPAAQQPQCNA